MEIVEHRKCKHCDKVQHVSYMKENENSELVCSDSDLCKTRQIKNNNLHVSENYGSRPSKAN